MGNSRMLKVFLVVIVAGDVRSLKRFQSDEELPDTQKCGKTAAYPSLLYGKQHTSIDEFPWLALLEYKKKHQGSGQGFVCGGTLISNQHVLTAAHCVTRRYEKCFGGLISVRLGEHNIDTKIDCDVMYPDDCADPPIDINIAGVIIHPDYDEDSMDQSNDIAILKLEKTVEFTDFVRPICLPRKLPSQIYTPDYIQFVAGWGLKDLSYRSPEKEQFRVSIVEKNVCSNMYRSFMLKIGPSQLCARREWNNDSCGSDTGGPLMVQAISNNGELVWYMTGIESIGPTPCARYKIPGIYTKVYDYMDWILEHVGG